MGAFTSHMRTGVIMLEHSTTSDSLQERKHNRAKDFMPVMDSVQVPVNEHQIWSMARWYYSPNHGIWTSALKHLNFFSSLKATWVHRCRVQRWWVRHQATRAYVSGSALIPRMADMVGFLLLGDDFGLFWPSLADGAGMFQRSRLQAVSLAGTCRADVLAILHDLALQSSHVVDHIWHDRCWTQWYGNTLLGAVQLWTPNVPGNFSVRSVRLGACQWPDIWQSWHRGHCDFRFHFRGILLELSVYSWGVVQLIS